MMEAVVLAGGFGTRLRPCVKDLPKPLAPVCGKPFIFYVLDYLYANGVRRAVISTGYMADETAAVIGKTYRGMVIDYSRESRPLGTGGGIKKALTMCKDKTVAVVNGDTFFDVDLFKMKKAHEESGFSITVAAKEVANAYRSGCIKTEGGKLTGFVEKGIQAAGKINGGVYFINKDALDEIDCEKFSFEKEVLESGKTDIGVFESNGFFIDIGIPEDYFAAQHEIANLCSKRTRKAVFIDRDGTLNKDKDHLFDINDFEFLENADKAVEQIKKAGYLVIVVTNQAAIAKGICGTDDVDALHRHINSSLAENHSVIIDGFYYCPHHPDGSVKEYRTSCFCRKPKPGLILKAVDDFAEIGITIDLENSFMLGNRVSDTSAGLNAGIINSFLIGSDEPFSPQTAAAHFESLYDFSQSLKQVF